MIDPFSIALAAAIGLAAAGLIVAFWKDIMEAVRNVVLPFFEKIDPRLKDLVANAFIWIDKNLAVPLRSKVIRAWRTLRRRVKAVLASYRYEGNSKWIRKIIAWAHRDDGTMAKMVQEQTVAYEDLPESVRAAHMKGEFSGWSEETDITELRDKEIALLEDLSH